MYIYPLVLNTVSLPRILKCVDLSAHPIGEMCNWGAPLCNVIELFLAYVLINVNSIKSNETKQNLVIWFLA